MGNGVRQCPDCGWTCYGARNEMKKHRRDKHPRPVPALVTLGAVALDTPASIEEAIDQVYTAARASQVDELSENVLGYLDHLHADVKAILAHLGIKRSACEDIAAEIAEEE